MKSSNNVSTGIIIGIIAPPITFCIFCLLEFKNESIIDLLKGYAGRNVLTHIISLSVLINLPIFFAFLTSNRELAARGVLGATFLYAFVVLILKLV